MTADKVIIFWADSKAIGLTSHFARQCIDMYNATPDDTDFYIISSDKEQESGLWDSVRKALPEQYIFCYANGTSSHTVITRFLESICSKYKSVTCHLQGMKSIWDFRKILARKNVFSVVTIHAFANGIPWKRPLFSLCFSLLILKYVNKAIFLSPFATRQFWGISLLKRYSKYCYIPFSLPVKAAAEEEERDQLLNSEEFNVVYLANFLKNKQHEKFLEILIAFVSAHSNAKIYLLGEGPRLHHVKKKVEAAKCDAQIICPGRVKHAAVYDILRKTSVALALSGSENAGHNAIEPMLSGVPVIGTRVGSAEYLIQDGISGFGIDSPEDLRNALEYFYHTPEAISQIGQSAKEMATHFFGYEDMIAAYFRLYKIAQE